MRFELQSLYIVVTVQNSHYKHDIPKVPGANELLEAITFGGS